MISILLFLMVFSFVFTYSIQTWLVVPMPSFSHTPPIQSYLVAAVVQLCYHLPHYIFFWAHLHVLYCFRTPHLSMFGCAYVLCSHAPFKRIWLHLCVLFCSHTPIHICLVTPVTAILLSFTSVKHF